MLIFDLGGGTFDVSLLTIDGGAEQTKPILSQMNRAPLQVSLR